MGQPLAWRGWYHITASTYGTWLRGDLRGWRSRHHREHVEGDYRHPPPPELHEHRLQRSRRELKRPPIRLTPAQRAEAGQALVWVLTRQVQLLALACGPTHVHLLARFGTARIRPLLGRAKRHASIALTPLEMPGRVWSRGLGIIPVKDRAHQLRVFRYVCEHRDEGAWVWTFRDPPVVRPEWEPRSG